MQDLDAGTNPIKSTLSLQYLRVTFIYDGKSTQHISNKIGQVGQPIRQLNSVLWSFSVTNKPKTASYRSIV